MSRPPVVVVLAKAPVPGLAKTRLAASEGPHRAADLAAAALLDTLETCARVFAPGRRVVALTGDLAGAARAQDLGRALASWQVVDQHPGPLGERVRQAVRDAHRLTGGPVVLLGMDTPQVRAADLEAVAAHAAAGRTVLGPATDGGWWVLAVPDPAHADPVAPVPTSRPDTGALTLAALRAAGTEPVATAPLRDVDTAADARHAADLAPGSRFARAWRAPRPAEAAP
ncbi:MAG TPA: DUF2064 domain-containing protein [Pedococcus sp.]|jgi:glycosyltransferase A (GT-A) superfamily protein (DUF2064 family)